MRTVRQLALRSGAFVTGAVTASVFSGMMLAAAGCSNDDLPGIKPDVKQVDVQLDLPAVPEFDLPPESQPHGVREMRLRGAKHLNTEVQIKGFVTWIYDCFESGGAGGPVGKPGMTEKQIRKIIADGRGRCWKPHFILGDAPETPGEMGIQVVEVPRELRKDEKRHMRRADLKALPPVPKFKVGDEVIVTGLWMQRSPAGFAATNGLLVYKSMEQVGEQTAENAQ